MPYTFGERKARVAQLEATLASIGTSKRRAQTGGAPAHHRGNVAGGEAKLDEAGEAEDKAAAEFERMKAEKLKAAARTFRERAVLAKARDVAKAVSYNRRSDIALAQAACPKRRATHEDPDDAQTWENYAEAGSSRSAG